MMMYTCLNEEGKEGDGTSEGERRSASEVAGPSAQSPPRSAAIQEARVSIDLAGAQREESGKQVETGPEVDDRY